MINLENVDPEMVKNVVVIIGFLAFGYGGWKVFSMYNRVKISVGWKFIDAMGKVKNSLSQFDLVLRVKSPAGREEYIQVKQSPLIEYLYFQKGKKVKKLVIYDERAVDYLNGIPILTVTPNDIRPIDRETGLLVNIPGEIIDKLAVDSARTAEMEAEKAKYMKMLVYTIIAMAVLFFVALTYINQTNAELQQQLAQMSIEMARSVTVIGN